MPKPLSATVLVQEQFALALNRDERGDEAEKVLLELLKKRGERAAKLSVFSDEFIKTVGNKRRKRARKFSPKVCWKKRLTLT